MRSAIERWIIDHADRPIYFTTKRDMGDLPGYPEASLRQEANYVAGMAYMRLKSPQEAIARFNAALEASPDGEWTALTMRRKAYAMCFRLQEASDLDAALEVLDDLAEKYPTPNWLGYVHYRKGRILAAQGKLLEAIAEYQRGITEQPTSPYTRWGAKRIKVLQERLEAEMLEGIVKKEGAPAATEAAAGGEDVEAHAMAAMMEQQDLTEEPEL